MTNDIIQIQKLAKSFDIHSKEVRSTFQEPIKLNEDNYCDYFFYLINLSFSIELHLKSLNNPCCQAALKTHNLSKLFNQLHNQVQSDILNKFKEAYTGDENWIWADFNRELKLNSDVFENLRYFFDSNQFNYNPKFLLALSNAVINYIDTN